MTKKVPTAILNKAKDLTAMYGQKFAYLGQHEGRAVWRFCFPEDADTGFPIVYLYGDEKAVEVTGREALDIINLLVKD